MTQPLGIVGGGPRAWVDERGTVALAGADASLRWWVRGEDRWHRADVDAAVRQRLVDDAPVVETSLRVPGGDAIAVAYAIASGDGAAVVQEVTNASPVPIAVALVIGPARSVRIDGSSVTVDGSVVELSRRPSASLAAPSLDALAERIDDAVAVDDAESSGFVAVVVALPHSQSLTCTLSGAAPVVQPVPDAASVVAGWQRHGEVGAQVVLPPGEAAAFARARSAVAMGPGADAPLDAVAAHVGAAIRLGWFEAALDPTDRLGAAVRSGGRIGDDAPTTIAALDAMAAWRRAGIPADGLEHLVGPVAAAASWLTRRGRRLDAAGSVAAPGATRNAVAFLRVAAQSDAAEAIERRATKLDGTPAQHAVDAPSVVRDAIDSLVDDDGRAVVLLAGWTPGWGREPIEASDVPTPWGLASFALRWHGERPALRWEIERWPAVTDGSVVVRSPALDPTWAGSGWRGEALLAASATSDPAVTAGESFS